MSRQGDPGAPLSAVQLQILAWTADGESVPEIATTHFYSEGTVKAHLQRIYRQLGARNAANAVLIACRAGLLPDADEERGRSA